MALQLISETVEVTDDLDAFQVEALERKWGDGLPLVPPTRDRVKRMLAGTDRDPDYVAMLMPPNFAACTAEKIAINAVMAGCLPDYMPVLIAAVEALGSPGFSLYGHQATTHPMGIALLVSGPIAKAIGMHAGSGVFGPGVRANATIGRAIRLLLQNVGGAYAGTTDMSTQGTPAKYTFAFAENQAESPWPPYHVSLGFDPETSAVTVAGAEGPHNISDHVSNEPRGLLVTFAQSIGVMGKTQAYNHESGYFVAFCPEHAEILRRFGWTREDVQRYLYERARIPYALWRLGGMFGMLPHARWIDAADDDLQVPMVVDASWIRVVVTGGPGRHSSWMPGGRAATQLVTRADGSSWK